MHIPRRRYHLTLHSLSEIQFTLYKIGMKSILRGAILISISLISRQLGDIPKIFQEFTTQK